MRHSTLIARVVLLLAPLLAGGCVVDAGPHHHGYYDYYYYGGGPNSSGPTCSTGVSASTIDTGSYYPLDAGLVGISAEYFGDGAWRFATACDTPQSGYDCNYVVTVTPLDGVIDSVAPEALEGSDLLSLEVNGDAHFSAVTAADIDAFTLEATPGATLEVSATIDGYCATPYVLWLSGGRTPDAPQTAALDLTPSSP
jgi:hypothetical protein